MTLNKYIKALQQIVKDNPAAGKLAVIYSSDDEGNSFDTVEEGYFGNIGLLTEDGDFYDEENIDEYFEDKKPNAICIN